MSAVDEVIAWAKDKRDQLAALVAKMQAREVTTRTNGRDDTDETVERFKAWIAELEDMIRQHRP